jgi:hypothetical protein
MATIKTKYSLHDLVFVMSSQTITRCEVVEISTSVDSRSQTTRYKLRTSNGMVLDSGESYMFKTEKALLNSLKRV